MKNPLVKRQYTISQTMNKTNLTEIYNVVDQIMKDEYPLLFDEEMFNDKDCDKICFTMKDYRRKGGLATYLANTILPGEDKQRRQYDRLKTIVKASKK